MWLKTPGKAPRGGLARLNHRTEDGSGSVGQGKTMKSFRAGATALVVAMGAGLASPAFACSPPAPPPAPAPPAGTSPADALALSLAWNQAHWTRASEDDRAWLMKRQAELFDKAAGI